MDGTMHQFVLLGHRGWIIASFDTINGIICMGVYK